MKPIADVEVNDVIRVSSVDGKVMSFSPVVSVPHRRNSESAVFVEIVTEGGGDVKLTGDHLLLSGVCGGEMSLVEAGSVLVGSCVRSVSGDVSVMSVSLVSGEGVYTVVTKHDGLIVVNGIVASPFAVNHNVANAVYNVHRMLHIVLPSWMLSSALLLNVIQRFGDVAVKVTM
jgi:hypothetical protein